MKKYAIFGILLVLIILVVYFFSGVFSRSSARGLLERIVKKDCSATTDCQNDCMFDSSVELQLAGCTSSFDGVRNVYLCQKETELHGHCGSVCPINKRGDNKFLLLKNNQPSEVNKVVILSDLECAEASD